MIRRVLTSLLSNAEKFAPDEARIEVHASRTSDRRAEIRIRDNGTGISRQQRAELARWLGIDLHSALRRSANPGPGIGLAVVRMILAAHQCPIRLTSRTDRGTTVTFELPLAPSIAPPQARPPSDAPRIS